MPTIAEEIGEADKNDWTGRMIARIQLMGEKERNTLMGYLQTTGAVDLAVKLFGIENLDIEEVKVEIYIPDTVQQIYMGNQYISGGLRYEHLSIGELRLLLSSFFDNTSEKEYIIETFLYEDAFTKKIHGNIGDYLEIVEKSFQKCENIQKNTQNKTKNISDGVHQIEAANDKEFTPLIDRIWDEEPDYFNYIHETYQARLAYVESLFIETIRHLAEEPHNHIWALDPEGQCVYIPPHLQSKIDLIRSICEFHVALDSDFPMLHTLVTSTLGSWILIYKGFSAPVQNIRRIIGS